MPPNALTKIVVRLVAAVGLLMALAYLFSRVFIPSGRLTIVDDFVHAAPYLSEPKPSERLGESYEAADGSLRTPLNGTPLFVDLTPPPNFTSATFTLEYENAGQPVVELAALTSAIDLQYAVLPLENRVIDALPWKQLSSGNLTLFQRGDEYASVDDFLRRPPPRAKVATYRADVPLPYRLEGYAPSGIEREFTLSLRGRARMLTYAKDEPLSFTFVVQDMNRLSGADPVTVSVYEGDAAEPTARTVLPDDGNTSDDQKSSKLRTVPVTITAPREGFYQIEFTATADTFIRSVKTRQSKLVFVDDLYVGDHVGYSDKIDPVTVYTDGGWLQARTPHAEAVQEISVGTKKLRIDQPNVRYETSVAGDDLTAVRMPKRSVLLQTSGLFALTQAEYFNPLPYSVQWYTTPELLTRRGIEYVLSSYEPPAQNGALISGKVTVDLSTLARTETGAYRFAIEAPGIEETRFPLLLKSLTVSLQRQPMSLSTFAKDIVDAFRPEPPRAATVVIDGKTYGEWPE